MLDLAFSAAEKENDAVGLRALRRISISYFRNKSVAATSKYGRYLITDLVIELASSQRTRRRMDLYVTVNPSGTRGGGMYRDKFNEVSSCSPSQHLVLVLFQVQVRVVKDAILKQKSALSDLTLQTLVRSLSVMEQLHKHNLKSRLYEFQSRHTSTDTVGVEKRTLLRELMNRTDPFNLERAPVTDFSHKSSGSPFAGLPVERMVSFLKSVRTEFELLYPASTTT